MSIFIKAKTWMEGNKKLTIILLAALMLRLILTPLGFHNDLLVNVSWGEWIYQNGPFHFYSNTVWPLSWPTQPPFISLVDGFNFILFSKILFLLSGLGIFIATHHLAPTHFLWFFDFVKWFGTTKYQLTTFTYGILITMKLFPIAADLYIGTLIYSLARPLHGRRGILWASIYLFVPFTFYLSGLWGQYDQFSFLFLLLAFLLIRNRGIYFSPLLLVLSIESKPTSLIFVPIFLYLYLREHPSWKIILFGFISSVFFLLITAVVFADMDIYHFFTVQLYRTIFLKSEFRVSTNAFNFWRVFIGDRSMNHDTVLFLIPTKFWGYLSFIVFNIAGYLVSKKNTLENMFKALFIIGAGSWFFMTNMLDRYLFAGIIFFLILTIFKPKLLKYWFVMAAMFCINLYNLWFFPDSFLKSILTWNLAFATRILSFINVSVFLIVAWSLVKPHLHKDQK